MVNYQMQYSYAVTLLKALDNMEGHVLWIVGRVEYNMLMIFVFTSSHLCDFNFVRKAEILSHALFLISWGGIS
jgi:hypothetical protein